MNTKEIRVINVPEDLLKDISAIALALGESKQHVYRQSFRMFIKTHGGLVEAGKRIMKTQAELRKE